MRRTVSIALAVIVIAVGVSTAMSVIAPPTADLVAPEEDTERNMVELEGSESSFSPYLSAAEEHRKGSSINIAVRADLDTTLQIMADEGDWNVTEEHEHDVGPEQLSAEQIRINTTGSTSMEWDEAGGSVRYAFVDDTARGNDAEFVTESAQVHFGDYYGHRYHIRMYEAPHEDDEWVIMQAHDEHFDWFTLRHAVHGNDEAQRQVERDFMQQDFVDDVWRMYVGNDEPYDNDGWMTVVELAWVLPLLAVGAIGRRRLRDEAMVLWGRLSSVDRERIRAAYSRLTLNHLLLFGGIVGLYFGVRVSGILLERYVPALSMHAIAALLYPFIAIGIPAVTYLIARRMTRRMDAGVVAAGALSTAVILDLLALSVSVMPIGIVVQRAGIVLALGLIAIGATDRATRQANEALPNDWLVVGATLWVALLVATLMGWI